MSTPIMETAVAGVRSLDGLFSESAARHPDRPALLINGEQWSYRQLNVECKTIERTLSAAGLIGKRCNIGVVYAYAMFSYAALIAVMRSGNVYVPLNGKLPEDRLLKIIEDANLQAMIIDATDGLQSGLVRALRQSRALSIISLGNGSISELEPALESATRHPLWRASEVGALHPAIPLDSNSEQRVSTDLAYIIYTSGSTGAPKGVALSHESVRRCMERCQQLFATSWEDRFTQFSPLSFDGSIFDSFLCWISGGALCVPAPSEALVPLKFAVTYGITVWGSVPSLASFMSKLNLLKPAALPKIRLTFFYGEGLPTELALAWAAASPQSRIFNLYGPTEFAICATYHEFQADKITGPGMVPIGEPLPGLDHRVVDEDRFVEDDDVPGELWLSGDQLAQGYWNNPAATQAAFVRTPADDLSASVWYRTGDLVSRRPGVGLVFRGRLDRQVKLRGLRIELQEIESILREMNGSALVAVVPLCNAGGMCEKIVAFCEQLNFDENTLKARCLERIPAYMIPERIIQLESFPLSSHGKVDYKALAVLSTVRLGFPTSTTIPA
jgi:D-alanine--poly(phosphoribitol) ligase subunit 1